MRGTEWAVAVKKWGAPLFSPSHVGGLLRGDVVLPHGSRGKKAFSLR